ncbi:MAG TPA: DUF885 domain-containing protein [Thermoanaerobaculia bacterium]|nr:DUF885 domain-containing protein [Thermoanaerobaculia bacterium]
MNAFSRRALSLGAVVLILAAGAPAAAETWVERSDANAQVLIDALARLSPEGAGQLGVPGLDEEIFDLKPGFVERFRELTRKAGENLRQRLAAEKDPKVRQDLEILIQATEDQLEGSRLGEKYTLPYFDVTSTVFQGLRTLLDDQVEASRRPAALVRLRKYTGVEPGYTPMPVLAEQFIRSRMNTPGLIGPVKDEIEKDLQNSETYLKGIEELFKKYGISGYEQPYAKLREQAAAYEAFVRKEILPRARTDFRQPAEIYAYNLRTLGVDMPVEELVSRAEVAFKEIQNEMQALAQMVAKERGLPSSDYRDVLREMKKAQVTGEAILPLYQQRIRDMERIIREQGIVTLPERPMKVRLASEAESAATPAPNMRPPRLIGNTGEQGEFVLPLRIPGKQGGQQLALDDFTYDALSWALTAHEGRPGHELQFASIVEKGVSKARVIFSFNSVNVEGWALYAEAEVKPYMPLEAQLAALQSRLMRAARAFLDPGLQAGTITREEATRVLREEVGLSEGMALQEVERYTFRSPGQATSYFCGYTRLMELRTEAERALGAKFDRQKYHDFILAQGLLPPALLRKAVMEEFVPSQVQVAQAGR